MKGNQDYKSLTYAQKLPCRCRKCKHRKSLRRKPHEYIRPPKCELCGSNEWFIDWHRVRSPESSSGGKICKSDCMAPIYGKSFIHKTNTKGCRQYEEHVLNRSLKSNSFGLTNNPEPLF